MPNLIITEEEKKQILGLYNLLEQDPNKKGKSTYQFPTQPNDMQAPLQTKPLKTNAGKYDKFEPTDADYAPFRGRNGTSTPLEKVKQFSPKKDTYKTKSEWLDKMAINILSQMETNKGGHGYWGYSKCAKCKVTVNDTYLKDKEKQQFCRNEGLYNNGVAPKNWDCEGPLGIIQQAYNTLQVDILTDKSFFRDIPPYVSDAESFWNNYKHEIMMIGSIGTLFIPLVGPAISVLFDAADIAMYMQEGNYEAAGLAAAFALIPLGDLLKIVGKGVAPEALQALVKRIRNKSPLTKLDKQIRKSIAENTSTLMRYTKLYGKRALLNQLFNEAIFETGGRGLRMWMYMMKGLVSKVGYPLLKVGIQIGGITYSYGLLYNYYNNKPEKFAEIEKKFHEEKPSGEVIKTLEQTSRQTTKEEEEKFVEISITARDLTDEEIADALSEYE